MQLKLRERDSEKYYTSLKTANLQQKSLKIEIVNYGEGKKKGMKKNEAIIMGIGFG